MKRIFSIVATLALCMTAFVACNKEESKNGGINLDEVTEDGFYVYGEGVGVTDNLTADYMMAVGINEVDGSSRSGMYEKYIYIEANKEFELVLLKGKEKTRYSAVLEDYDTEGENDQPTIIIKRGALLTGDDAPAMKVDSTCLYHIVLDINEAGDLGNAQIVLAPVEWGVSGGMNSWGYTKMTCESISAKSAKWVVKDQKLAAGGEFKFKYGNGWKIQLDDAGNVKANTNLGADMIPAGSNIAVEKAGLYDITLTYTLKGGDIKASYACEVTLTQESQAPTTMYMIGTDFGNWDWASDGVVALNATNNSGEFWCVRYVNAANGFKFCAEKAWNGDFTGLGTDTGYTVSDGNCFVPENGLYMIYVNTEDNKVTMEKAQVYGMGDAFADSWTEGANEFTANGTVMTLNADKTGIVRAYATWSGAVAGTWWTREFCAHSGAITYRQGGDENHSDADAAEAGQLITIDFNAGTMTFGGEVTKTPASALTVGFSGGCFSYNTNWADPLGAGVAVYDETSGDENPVYVCQALTIGQGSFKLRLNGDWVSSDTITIEGDGLADDGGNDHNIYCANAGTYKAVITFKWSGSSYSDVKVTFTPATMEERTNFTLRIKKDDSWFDGFIPSVQSLLLEEFGLTAEQLQAANANGEIEPQAVSDSESNDTYYNWKGEAVGWDGDGYCWYVGPYYGREGLGGDTYYSLAYGKNPGTAFEVGDTTTVDYVITYGEKSVTLHITAIVVAAE